MADLSLSALVTRTDLSLADLNINDSTNYRIAGPEIMAGQVSWDRQQINSPWVEGDITISRRRPNVNSQLTVYVAGTDQANLMTNIRTLVSAFSQDRYTLQINIGSAVNQWDCEAADYSVQMDTAHVYGKYIPVSFNIPRNPVPLSGGY